MRKKTLKMLAILSVASFISAGYVSANDCCSTDIFAAKSCETKRITIGGFIAANYQWVDTDDNLIRPANGTVTPAIKHVDPDQFNNFYMKNIRLYLSADLCDCWRALISIDFAGRDWTRSHFCANQGVEGAQTIDSAFTCRDQWPLYIDRAYIEKRWCNTVFRAGYQKVNFGAEEVIPDEYLKTINRSVATNFFLSLGHRAVNGFYDEGRRNIWYGGNRFADRHVGIYLSGDVCNFRYNLAIVNGYQGICRNSTQFNNELGYFAGIAYDTSVCNTDLLLGINAGFKPEGANWNQDGLTPTFPGSCDRNIETPCIAGNPTHNDDHAVWAINPYILANWNCLTVLAELLYGGVQSAQLQNYKSDANPYGFNLIPSYMFNDNWELVARFSYLNTNKMGTTINNAFGAAPDGGSLVNSDLIGDCRSNTFIASELPFDKVTSGYIGINYYTACQQVKLTLGWEVAKFKNPFRGNISTTANVGGNIGAFENGHVTVNAVRAQLQLMF